MVPGGRASGETIQPSTCAHPRSHRNRDGGTDTHTTLADERSCPEGTEPPRATASLSSPGPSAKWSHPVIVPVTWCCLSSRFCFFSLVWLDIHIVQNSKSKQENATKASRPHPASAWTPCLSQKASAVEFPGFAKIQAQAGWQEAAFSVPPAAGSPP